MQNAHSVLVLLKLMLALQKIEKIIIHDNVSILEILSYSKG